MELREQVFELIKNTKKNEPVNLRKFKGMGPKSISMVEKILNQYLQAGILYTNRLKELFVNQNFKTYEGEVVRVRDNFMFVSVEELDDDIYVRVEDSRTAMIKDKVELWLDSVDSGVIEKIITRGNEEVIGIFHLGKKSFVWPRNDEIRSKIIITNADVSCFQDDLVKVKITSFGEKLEGTVIQNYGNIHLPGQDILALALEHQVPVEFSKTNIDYVNENVEQEIINPDLKDRLDLRNHLIVTIDGDNARDFDDAIEVYKNEDGTFTLGVHIADVSNYVKEGNPIDKDAVVRGTSVYLTDRVIPMLPFELSNGICSLNPNVDRYTMSCIMKIDYEGKVVDYEISPSIINSKYRLTYNKVNELFAHKHKFDNEELNAMLYDALLLSKIIRKERENRGSMDLDKQEAEIVCDDKGKPIDIIKRVRGDAEMMIEDFMIMANETVASHVYFMNLPFVYRIHDEPNIQKLQDFALLLKPLGYTLNAKNGVHSTQLQAILDKSHGTPEHDVIAQLMLRSLSKAKYSEENIGHFSLGSDCYTHFTSPIRRYPDLMVHRLLRLYRTDYSKVDLEQLEQNIASLAKSSSDYERRAMSLERKVEDVKKAEYMQEHLFEAFEGRVSGIIDIGVFIELDNTIEGLLRFSSLKDHYIFDSSKMVAYCKGSKKTIKLGDTFKVMAISASKSTGKIEFSLAKLKKEKTESSSRKRKK